MLSKFNHSSKLNRRKGFPSEEKSLLHKGRPMWNSKTNFTTEDKFWYLPWSITLFHTIQGGHVSLTSLLILRVPMGNFLAICTAKEGAAFGVSVWVKPCLVQPEFESIFYNERKKRSIRFNSNLLVVWKISKRIALSQSSSFDQRIESFEIDMSHRQRNQLRDIGKKKSKHI